MPKDVSLEQFFTKGGTFDLSESVEGQDAASSHEAPEMESRRLDEDQDTAAVPPPVLATAFDADVWPLLGRDTLTTSEIQKAVEQASETPRRTGHSDADFGDDDVDASVDQQVEPGDF